MISSSEADFLRSAPSRQLVEDYSEYCRSKFQPEGLPVVIAAHNEAEDLPATLISIASSDIDVMPIVVENGSTDETFEVAKKMGAVALVQEQAAKMAALQMGVQVAVNDHLSRQVLFTDADTLIGKRWARTMLHALQEQPEADYAAACGGVVFAHGQSRTVDTLRSINALVKDAKSLMCSDRPIERGPNMALDFGYDDKLLKSYMQIRPDLFVGEERAICDITEANGGAIRRVLGLRALVVTRGDRFSTLRECLKVKKDEANRLELYGARQSAYTRYDGTNATLAR